MRRLTNHGATKKKICGKIIRTLCSKIPDCAYFEIGTWRGESAINVADVTSSCVTLNLSNSALSHLGFGKEYIDAQAVLSKDDQNITHLQGDSMTFDFADLNKKFDIIFIDGNHLEKFSGDGIIISTPAGSTAYNLSAGGSIIFPSLKALQITPLAPINSKAFRSLIRSAVVPGDLVIKIKPEFYYTNSTLILNDGMEFKYDNIDSINFKISNRKIYKLNFDKDVYWNNLKSKFL